MLNRLNDPNFGNSRNKNLQYQWFVDGVLQKTTLGPVCATVTGFNGEGIYLDLTESVGKVLVEFNVTQSSGLIHRIKIPDLDSINGGVNAKFLTDGYIRETLPGTNTEWGTHSLLLESGRIYGPITSDTYGSGFLAVASEINQGGNRRLLLYDGGGGPYDDMVININKGFFKTYLNYGTVSRSRTVGGITFNAVTPPRVKDFSTYTTSSPVTRDSSVICRVSQSSTSGNPAGLPQDSPTVTWSVRNYQCLNPDDTRKPGAVTNVVTNSGLKPSLESIWFGVWEFGTPTDTCGIQFNLEIKDIVPRASFSETWKLSVEFEFNIGSNDRYRVYKVLDWNGRGTNANSNDRKNLDFNPNNVDGNTNVWYGDNGIELFRRTNDSPTKWSSGHSGFGLYWDPAWGTPKIFIRVGRAKRKRDGATINWYPEILTAKRDNILSYGRRFDPYKETY